MTLCVALCLPAATWAQTPSTTTAPNVESASAARAPMHAQAPTANGTASTQALSLRQAIELALTHNPDLAIAALEVGANEGARQQAGAYPNPEISWLQEDTQRATRTTTLQLNLPIELGGKRAARVAAAERGFDIASEDLAAQRLEIRAAVTARYFDTLAAQERVRVTDDALELAGRATRAAALRVKAGKVAAIEETKASVAEAGVQVEASQARSDLRSAQARLGALLGKIHPGTLMLDGQLDELPIAPSQEEAQQQVENSPALRRARLEIEHRMALTELEKARRIPDLTVSLGAKREEALGRNQAIVGVSIPLPLFDRNQGNLLEALKREDKAREALRSARLQVAADALQARERLESARMEAGSLAAQVLPGAQSAYEAAVKGFELGKFSFLEALDAQRTLLQARMQYLRATADAHRARAELDRILGSADVEPKTSAPTTR
ncbi:MAG: cobalt-zinc-cadmium resistance protein [Betaproteobacteria bacterium HGW-Betaproteobacteria-13]|nr:MAG: cobalt-zinc-cadmium resistance protein [Betaproteobacteria bacterium HGW-Betaproteobacteria-13]